MSNYPGALDAASTLYTPVDAFSAKPLETTTTGAVLAGDSTINVASTTGGFAATYGVLSIDDELVVYTGKTGAQFTGCQRGAFGTAAAGHGNGVAVKANMVAGFITALQSAVLAIENELGTAAARNYIRKDGAVTVTGLKTFQDGAEFGAGAKSSTGLVRLPNGGAVKWRKQDNSGDLGIALNASNHLAMDAVIDFAAGQTFGASTVPDATTLAKGIVQVDPVGGISVAAGVISLSASGVGPGTYTKVTVDAWGRATAGAFLAAGDLPAHTHVAADIVSGALPFTIQNNGAAVGTRRALNLIQGSGIGLTLLDVPASDRVNVTIALGAHTHAEADVTNLAADLAGKAPTHPHARRSRYHRPGNGPRGQGGIRPHAHVFANQRCDRQCDRGHDGPPRRFGRRVVHVHRRKQRLGVPGLASSTPSSAVPSNRPAGRTRTWRSTPKTSPRPRGTRTAVPAP